MLITWPEDEVSDESLAWFIADSEARLARRALHVSMHDGVRAGGLSSRQRKIIAEHTRRVEPLLRDYMVAAAIVSRSAVVHGAITAINWLAPPVFPQKVFSRADEAEAWLLAEFERRRPAPDSTLG